VGSFPSGGWAYHIPSSREHLSEQKGGRLAERQSFWTIMKDTL